MRLAENQRLLTPDVRRGKGYEGQKTQKEQLIGIQIKLKMDLTLEGYRPKGIVRFYPPTWKVIALPWEEEFFGKE